MPPRRRLAAGPPRPDLAQSVEADVHADELAFTDMLAACVCSSG